ncbi:FadR/GntR family transcriptional regulator [Vineibacter terrae]|uniref:FadR/GntR family transcriptional regulator n=1 Tax=Vineibacter terrae TaxID=2586908 RepID=UPI002E31AE42|nr:FCD domain-containing protein [Vineibacter terrae]HEX2889248.1 FCD domain-containing protein [Vineibacter terrae]
MPSGRVAGLQQALIDAIGQRIMSGEWPAGRQLPPEAALLARFGVSRPTLREALRVLASKGLIESRQKVGTSVCPTTAWNFLDPDVLRWLAGSPLGEATARELVGFRRMIEPQVALLAATAADAPSIKAVRAAFDDMARSRSDKMAYYMADRRFHQALFAATRNRFVDALGRTVMVVLDFSFSLQSRSLIDPDRGLALHQRVCEAIEARDAAAAEAAMFQLLGEAEVELSRAGR